MSRDQDLTRDLMEFGLDMRARRVFLQTFIGEDEEGFARYNAAEEVTRALLFLDRTTGPIELWINSPGGDVDDALAIHDVILALNSEVHTVGHGQVSSAATLLLACGTGVRYATPTCTFMHHASQGGSYGTAELNEIRAIEHKRIDDLWAKLLARYTKHTAAWWKNKTREIPELYMTSTQMKVHGIIDELWVK